MFAHGPILKSMVGATFITALKTHAPTRSVNGIETTENSRGYPRRRDNAAALLIQASPSTALRHTPQVACPFRWACKAIRFASSSVWSKISCNADTTNFIGVFWSFRTRTFSIKALSDFLAQSNYKEARNRKT